MKKHVIAALREDVAKYQSSNLKVNSPIEIYLFLAYKESSIQENSLSGLVFPPFEM